MTDNPALCRVLWDKATGVKFQSATSRGLTLTQIIEDDKNYGFMKPANGKYFTYAVLNEDQEMNRKEVEKSVSFGMRRWQIYAKIPKFKRVQKDFTGVIDFRIEFRTVESDPDKQLTKATVMYHYYPINDVNHPLRGLCVVNKMFFFTAHGNAVSGHFMKSKGFNVQFPEGLYESLDFDQIYGHELGHGALGLPHDPEEGNMMAYRVDLMTEFPSVRDIARDVAKFGKKIMGAWLRKRWLQWLIRASDR